MKKIVVCGDSFNCGIGVLDLQTQPYGVLLAQKLGAELVTLARGSASNFAVHLQVEYAARMDPKPDLIVIGTTSYDRIEWIEEGKTQRFPLEARHINYHLYPPHHNPEANKNPFDHHFLNKSEYDPCLLTEQVGGIDDYIKVREREKSSNVQGAIHYYKRLHTEPIEKLKRMCQYYVEILNGDIKRNYDVGVLLKSYLYAKKRGIKCVILSNDPLLLDLVPADEIHSMNWFGLSQKYPDKIGSMHASEEAHAIVAEELYRKLVK